MKKTKTLNPIISQRWKKQNAFGISFEVLLCLILFTFVLVPLIAAGVAGLIMTPAINIGGKKFMKLNFGKFLWQAVAYTFELVFMSTLLICFTIQNAKYLLFALGILLIFVSDMFLSMNYFQEGQANNKPVVFLNHIIYYAGQILIALFIFLI